MFTFTTLSQRVGCEGCYTAFEVGRKVLECSSSLQPVLYFKIRIYSKKVKCYLTDYMFYLDLIITTTLKLETFVGLLFFYMQKIDNEHNELTRKLTKNYNNKNNRKY